jgi:hypothetical protein
MACMRHTGWVPHEQRKVRRVGQSGGQHGAAYFGDGWQATFAAETIGAMEKTEKTFSMGSAPGPNIQLDPREQPLRLRTRRRPICASVGSLDVMLLDRHRSLLYRVVVMVVCDWPRSPGANVKSKQQPAVDLVSKDTCKARLTALSCYARMLYEAAYVWASCQEDPKALTYSSRLVHCKFL